MKQIFEEITVQTKGRELKALTQTIRECIRASGLVNGLCQLSILHTSASLVVQENADPDVQDDLVHFFEKLVPREFPYRHRAEGPDDMPAHIKTALTQTHLGISFRDREVVLGTWQGVYLWEHRDRGSKRSILLHLLGE